MIKKLLFPVLCFAAQLLYAQSDLSGIVTNYNLDMDECKVSRIDVRYHLYNQIGQTGVHLDVSWQTTGTDPDCLAGKTVYYFIKCHTQNPGDHYGELILNAGSGGTILKAGAGFGSDLSASPDYSQLFVSPETYNPSDPNTTLDQRLNNNGKSFQYLDQTMAQQYWKNGLVVDGIDVVINKNNTGMSVPTFNNSQSTNTNTGSNNTQTNTPATVYTPPAPVYTPPANATEQQKLIAKEQQFNQNLQQQIQNNYKEQEQVGAATEEVIGALFNIFSSIHTKKKAKESILEKIHKMPEGFQGSNAGQKELRVEGTIPASNLSISDNAEKQVTINYILNKINMFSAKTGEIVTQTHRADDYSGEIQKSTVHMTNQVVSYDYEKDNFIFGVPAETIPIKESTSSKSKPAAKGMSIADITVPAKDYVALIEFPAGEYKNTFPCPPFSNDIELITRPIQLMFQFYTPSVRQFFLCYDYNIEPNLAENLDVAFEHLRGLLQKQNISNNRQLSSSEPVSPDYGSTGVKSSNKQTYTDGSSYEGDLVNNIRSGTGTNVWANGDKYTGEWANGQITGKGVYTYSNGNIYDGYWKDGVCSGQGKFTITTGDVSIGNFGGGKLNGKGQYIFADGRKYDGMWKDGIKSGQGTFTWPNGDKYTGQWANDNMNGHGELNYADGRKYVGDYKNGLQDGYGKLSLANGENYTGQWKDNNANGPGAYTYLGGGKFEGNYKNGLRDGPGTFTYANGNHYSGNWVNDVEVGNSAANPTPVVPAKPIAHPDKMDEAVKPLVKKWRCVDIASTDTVFTNMDKEKLTQLKEAIKTITMDFKADYTFEAVKEAGEKSAGTWEVNTKEKKLITMDAGGKDEKLLISLTADKLVIGLDANSSLVFAPYKNGQATVKPSPATDGSLNPPCYIIGYSAVAAESIAKQYVTDLTQKGFTAGYMWVPDYEPNGKAIYRVYVGPFKTMQQANAALPGVKQIQAGAYIKLIDRQ